MIPLTVPPRPGESKEAHRACVAAAQAAMKARMEKDVTPGRGTPTPKKPTKVPVTPPSKDRPMPKPAPGKPVMLVKPKPGTPGMKRGGMVKGKK